MQVTKLVKKTEVTDFSNANKQLFMKYLRLGTWIVGLFFVFVSCKKNPINLQRIEGKQISVSDSLEADSSLVSIIAPYKIQLENDMNQVLAFAPTDLFKSRDMVETNIGNFMTDLCYKRGNVIFNNLTGKNIDFVLMNYGGIRASISKGDVTTRNAFEVMPFENSMVVAELTYEKVMELLDYLAKSGNPHPFSKQLNVVFENDKLISAEVNNKKIDKNRTCFILTSDYLQHGGDRMYFFKDPISLVKLDYKIRTAIIDELKEIDTIRAKVDGRVVRR